MVAKSKKTADFIFHKKHDQDVNLLEYPLYDTKEHMTPEGPSSATYEVT